VTGDACVRLHRDRRQPVVAEPDRRRAGRGRAAAEADGLAHQPGGPVPRQFRVPLLDPTSHIARDVVVDVSAGTVVSLAVLARGSALSRQGHRRDELRSIVG
jgi:hypothetical protein